MSSPMLTCMDPGHGQGDAVHSKGSEMEAPGGRNFFPHLAPYHFCEHEAGLIILERLRVDAAKAASSERVLAWQRCRQLVATI